MPLFLYPRVTFGSQGDPALTRGYSVSPTSWLSSVHNEEVNGSGSYFFQQSSTDDSWRSTFDSHRSTQRIDGTGDTHYQGNRTLGGNGWQGHWTERQFAESEVEHGSYYSPLFPEDDRPNSYNVTIDHSAEASADTPIPYGYSTNPPVNTPPAGSLGPGGFATQEDSQAIRDLQGQVAMNGSAAALDYSARDELFAALAAGTEELAVDDSNSAATSQSASTLTRAYVTDSGSSSSVLNGLDPVNLIADPDSRLAIQRGVHFPSQFKLADHMQRLSTRSTEAQTTGGRGDLCIRFPGTCTGASPSSGNSDDGNNVGQSALEDPGFGVRDAASIGVGFIPFVGSGQSVVELISGYDYIGGEPTSRWLAAVGIFAGVVPGGKGALKGGSKLIKIAGDGATHADEFVDTAKAVSKAPSSATSRFSKTTTHWQRTVHQRPDIDWELVRPDGLTNFQAARRGYTPKRINPETGKWDDITLHHLNDDPRGGVVEVWRSTHGRFHKTMSREPNPWRAERPDWATAWDNEQSAYWRWRTGAYNPTPTSILRLPGD